jgi:hypothetical protein
MIEARQSGGVLLGLSLVQFGGPAMAQGMEMRVQEGLDACRRIDNVEVRLACYDALPGARVTGGPATVDTQEAAEELAEFAFPVPLGRSPMTRRWELDDATHGGLLRIRTYYPDLCASREATAPTATSSPARPPGSRTNMTWIRSRRSSS